MVQYTQQQRSVIVTSSNVARVFQDYAQSDLVADFETQRLRDLTQSLTAVIRSISLRGRCIKKSKKKLTIVSFMYVCVAENAELLVFFFTFFCTFPIGNFLS